MVAPRATTSCRPSVGPAHGDKGALRELVDGGPR
jgi:hypothetical protein